MGRYSHKNVLGLAALERIFSMCYRVTSMLQGY